jgi:hypothetical protein
MFNFHDLHQELHKLSQQDITVIHQVLDQPYQVFNQKNCIKFPTN